MGYSHSLRCWCRRSTTTSQLLYWSITTTFTGFILRWITRYHNTRGAKVGCLSSTKPLQPLILFLCTVRLSVRPSVCLSPGLHATTDLWKKQKRRRSTDRQTDRQSEFFDHFYVWRRRRRRRRRSSVCVHACISPFLPSSIHLRPDFSLRLLTRS